jgi:hypothetical protein
MINKSDIFKYDSEKITTDIVEEDMKFEREKKCPLLNQELELPSLKHSINRDMQKETKINFSEKIICNDSQVS